MLHLKYPQRYWVNGAHVPNMAKMNLKNGIKISQKFQQKKSWNSIEE